MWKLFFGLFFPIFIFWYLFFNWNQFGFYSYQASRELKEKEPEPIAKLLFVGDLLFDRTIRNYSMEEGWNYPLSCVKEKLFSYDAVIANLEGPVTSYESVSAHAPIDSPENTRFTFHPETANVLFKNNIRIVNLGNNHLFDFGIDGITMTRNYLNQAGVDYFGDPENGKINVLIKNINGVRVAFVSFNEWFGSLEESILSIEKLSSKYPVIVYTHWGDEYVGATDRVKSYAHKMVDAGADIVIGSHPHVIQEIEEYKDVHIFYSLGNFLFDQFWNESVRTGLAVEVSVKNDGISGVSSFMLDIGRDRRVCVKS